MVDSRGVDSKNGKTPVKLIGFTRSPVNQSAFSFENMKKMLIDAENKP